MKVPGPGLYSTDSAEAYLAQAQAPHRSGWLWDLPC